MIHHENSLLISNHVHLYILKMTSQTEICITQLIMNNENLVQAGTTSYPLAIPMHTFVFAIGSGRIWGFSLTHLGPSQAISLQLGAPSIAPLPSSRSKPFNWLNTNQKATFHWQIYHIWLPHLQCVKFRHVRKIANCYLLDFVLTKISTNTK